MNNLIELLSPNYISEFQNKISDRLGISVVISNFIGDQIGHMKDCTEFCRLINSTQKGANLCKKSKSRFHKVYSSSKNECICSCHMGVKNIAKSIVIDDQLVGNVIIGQFITKDDYKLLDTDKIATKLDIDKSNIENALLHVPIICEKTLYTYLQYVDFIVNYLKEACMKTIYHNEINTLKEEIKKEKLKTLQSQINPHFLFNTLNSISRMALLEDSPNTLEMVYCLSDLLRYTIDKYEEFPTIESEISNIEKYLFIQSIRYKNRLDFNIDIDNEILKYRIPAMILQPIVENAIVHGIEPKSTHSTIDITGRIKDNRIQIIIKDSGVGIDDERLNKIKDNNFKDFGMGISNPHQRIKHYFGDNFGLNIDSIKNVETTVEINIPAFTQLSLG